MCLFAREWSQDNLDFAQGADVYIRYSSAVFTLLTADRFSLPPSRDIWEKHDLQSAPQNRQFLGGFRFTKKTPSTSVYRDPGFDMVFQATYCFH